VSTQPNYIGGLDIGGTKVTALVADGDRPLARITEPTCKSGDIRALPEQTLAMLRKVCEQAGLDVGALDRVGVSSAGPFARIDGMLGLATPNICGARSRAEDLPNDWDIIPLEAVLREQFSQVVIENDCVAALSAERCFGAVQDEPDCVYVTWSTGVGFGLCVDGRILHGKHGNAGHAGHILRLRQPGRPGGTDLGSQHWQAFAAASAGDFFSGAQWRQGGACGGVGGGPVVWSWLVQRGGHTRHARLCAGRQRLATSRRLAGAHRAAGNRKPDAGADGRGLAGVSGAWLAGGRHRRLVMPPEWVEPWRQSRPWESLKA
jgi:glucokinase